jgi:CheY-like chemotaxis protein
LVDDGRDNQALISFLLRKAGLEVVVAENGAQGVELAIHDRFDVILMDMQMPVMDGYTAVRTIRQHGCLTPILAFTANILKHDIERCLEVGCADYIPKPFDRQTLFDKISVYLPQLGSARSESPSPDQLN